MAGIGGITGLVTGLDTYEIINKIMELERRPIEALETRIAGLISTRSAYETLEANLLALKVDAQRLYRKDRFLSFEAVSSDEDIIAASAGSTARTGTYTVTVSQLAQNHQVKSRIISDTDTVTIGTGTITISVGDSSPLSITVDSSNNTLEGIAEAINEADSGVQAVVVNVGGDEPAYRLLLSGNETGSLQRIVIDENLSGGTGLGFGDVEEVVYGTWNGTAGVASSGNYTGDSNATFSFSVTSGGTVGSDAITISYTDGGDISGTVTVPSGYEAGTEFHVCGGMKISLGSGTVIEGETFSIDVESSTIQAPVNAQLTLGSTAGGGTPIEVESDSNTVTELIQGVTLDLLRASSSTPITVNVNVDISSMRQKIEDFVAHFNAVSSFFRDHFSYDEEVGEGGELFGDAYAMRLSQAIRQQVMDKVEGLSQDLDNLTVLGIGTSTDGTLVIDASVLDEVIRERPEELVKLFSTTGTSTDSNIKFLFASSKTEPSFSLSEEGYEVRVTVAATKASQDASSITAPTALSPLVIDDNNNHLRITINGKTSSLLTISNGAYTSGEDLASALESAINADDSLGASMIDVQFVDDGSGMGHFTFISHEYGSNSTVQFESVETDSIYGTIGVTAGILSRGTDVAGTINGEEATGRGRYLTGNDGNEYTEGLQLLVSITADQLAEQGELVGNVTVSKGVGTRVNEYVNSVTDRVYGAITYRKEALSSMEESLQGQIDLIEAKLKKRQERLIDQFVQLENAIAELKAQESYMNDALQGLWEIVTYKSNR